MATIQEHYYEVLAHRVRNDKYPSHQLLNRIERALATSEQIADYVEMLIEKCDESWYPSHQLLARVERMLQLVAATA